MNYKKKYRRKKKIKENKSSSICFQKIFKFWNSLDKFRNCNLFLIIYEYSSKKTALSRYYTVILMNHNNFLNFFKPDVCLFEARKKLFIIWLLNHLNRISKKKKKSKNWSFIRILFCVYIELHRFSIKTNSLVMCSVRKKSDIVVKHFFNNFVILFNVIFSLF